jgi:hypothetical protein
MAADPPLSAAQLHGLACAADGARGARMLPDPDGDIDSLFDPEDSSETTLVGWGLERAGPDRGSP